MIIISSSVSKDDQEGADELQPSVHSKDDEEDIV